MTTLFGLIGFATILTVGLSMLMPMILMSPPTLTRPIDCEIGVECFIQNYVDGNPAKGESQDYKCGHMTYDGHKGTDFRTRNLAQMYDGVDVVAAANGTVLRVRDGMEDASIRSGHAPNIAGSECGNGLVISHSNGFETQYCHLKKGSIAVAAEDSIKRGQKLGEVGLSGKTEFPHLHFALRNKDGEVVDPFSGVVGASKCSDTENQKNLWHQQYRKQMAYKPTAILSWGFADKRPSAKGARMGEFSSKTIPPRADPFIFWVDAMGLHKGDKLVMQLYGPDRVSILNHAKIFDDNKAQYFQFIGSRLRNNTPWKAGKYTGSYRIIRDGEDLINQLMVVEVEAEPTTATEPTIAP